LFLFLLLLLTMGHTLPSPPMDCSYHLTSLSGFVNVTLAGDGLLSPLSREVGFCRLSFVTGFSLFSSPNPPAPPPSPWFLLPFFPPSQKKMNLRSLKKLAPFPFQHEVFFSPPQLEEHHPLRSSPETDIPKQPLPFLPSIWIFFPLPLSPFRRLNLVPFFLAVFVLAFFVLLPLLS